MKRIITGAAIGALSLVFTTGVVAANAPAPAAHDTKAQTTQPAQTTAMAPSQKPQSSTTTTTRGPAKTGQPNQSCEELGNQPGSAASAPGSAFNPNGKAGSVYAGNQPQNSRNTASVSQYDVACARPSK